MQRYGILGCVGGLELPRPTKLLEIRGAGTFNNGKSRSDDTILKHSFVAEYKAPPLAGDTSHDPLDSDECGIAISSICHEILEHRLALNISRVGLLAGYACQLRQTIGLTEGNLFPIAYPKHSVNICAH